MRIYDAHSGARRARSLSNGVSDARVSRAARVSGFEGRLFSGVTEARSAGGDKLSRLAGSGETRRFLEHDASGAEHEQVRKWCGKTSRRSFASDVSTGSYRSDYEWRARGDVDFAVIPANV